MKKNLTNQIKSLQSEAISKEEFMTRLAQIDEHGQLTPEAEAAINGGTGVTKTGSLIDIPVMGIWTSPDLPIIRTVTA